jgi:hypothetical protein
MSFVENRNQQIGMSDRFFDMTDREKKMLGASWASTFAKVIFPAICEEDFAVLFSQNSASRPNTPVNVIVGAMIIKELLGLTDDEVLESLIFDYRFQHALHTEFYTEQPLSDRTFSRFRARCIEYERNTGIDLVNKCFEKLTEPMGKMMGLLGNVKRMDSMMIASNIRYLSRYELLYVCVTDTVKRMKKNEVDIPEALMHYCEDGDFNMAIYHTRSEGMAGKIAAILRDADMILSISDADLRETNEFRLLARAFSEQVDRSADGELALKKAKSGMNGSILQSPYDPDATFRSKAGKNHQGYAANLIEDVGDNGSLINSYQYDRNIQSDSQFFKDYVNEEGPQESPVKLTADGAYAGEDNETLAAKNNFDFATTNLSGSKPDQILLDIKFTEDGKGIATCGKGIAPESNSFDEKKGTIKATFNRDACANCIHKDKCKAKIYKKKAVLTITSKKLDRINKINARSTDEFKARTRLRNGVEALPSLLRNKFSADTMPVRGFLRTKLWFGFKVMAVNVIKFRRGLRKKGRSMPNDNKFMPIVA